MRSTLKAVHLLKTLAGGNIRDYNPVGRAPCRAIPALSWRRYRSQRHGGLEELRRLSRRTPLPGVSLLCKGTVCSSIRC